MKIIFNALGCGLGNCGGTKTIIRSAETLRALGCDVKIVTRVNNYTWSEVKVPIIQKWEHCDVAINVSVWDIGYLLERYCKSHYWWLRGLEFWVRGENAFNNSLGSYSYLGGKLIVNATHLKRYLADAGIKSDVCFSGLDLDVWEDMPIITVDDDDSYKRYKVRCFVGKSKELPRIGGVTNSKHESKNIDCVKLPPENKYFLLDAKGVKSYEALLRHYNSCDIWVSTSEFEGFHNIPAEANLCGCLVYGNRHPHNGIGDYATEETAELYSTSDELLEKLKNPDFSKVPKMQKVLREKIGSREKNMKRFLELIG